MMRIGIVAARGLGDGLITLVLAHHLRGALCDVTTFSSPLLQLKSWFPEEKIKPFPKADEINSLFSSFDQVIAFDHSILSEQKLSHPALITLSEDSLNPKKSFVDNLVEFGKNRFNLKSLGRKNGIAVPSDLTYRKYETRIAIHPMSGDEKRTWTKEKFLQLASALQKRGFTPALLMAPSERNSWEDLAREKGILFPPCQTLDATAAFLYESGFFIGNDSGLGHLASNLGIPTLSLFARYNYSRLWRPGFREGLVVSPPPLIIGSRAKERTWKKMLSVARVLRAFSKLVRNQKRWGQKR